MQVYRKTSLGLALTDTLDEMLAGELLSPDLAEKVKAQFDSSLFEALQSVNSKATITGNIHTYNYLDHVWTFVIEKPHIKIESLSIHVDALKIVAIEGTIIRDEEDDPNFG